MMSSLFIKFGQREAESGIKGSDIQECGIWNDSVTPQNFQNILGTQPQEYFLDQKHLCVYTDKSLAEICSCLASAPSHPSQNQLANCSPDVLTLTQRCPFADRQQQMNLFHPWHFQSMFPEWLTGLLAVQWVPLPYLTQRRCSTAKENKCEWDSWEFTRERKLNSFSPFFINESQSRRQLPFKGEGINYRVSWVYLPTLTHTTILRIKVIKEWHGCNCLKMWILSLIPKKLALHQCGRICVLALIFSAAGKILIYVLLGLTSVWYFKS